MDRVGFEVFLKGDKEVITSLQEVNSVIKSINGRKISLQFEKIQISREIEKINAQIRELQNKKLSLGVDTAAINRVEEHIKTIQREAARLKDQKLNLKFDLGDVERRINHIKDQISALKTYKLTLATDDYRLEAINKRLQELNNELTEANGKKINIKGDIGLLARQIEAANREIERLNRVKADLKVDDPQIKKIDAEISSLIRKRDELTASKRSIGLDMETANAQMSEARARASELQEGLRAVEEQANRVRDAFSKIGGAISGAGRIMQTMGDVFGGNVVGTVKTMATAFGTMGLYNAAQGTVQRYDTMRIFPKMMEHLGYSAADATAEIHRMEEAVLGLPTGLDEIAESARQLIPLTGDLKKGTDLAIAVNNAFLAGGADAQATRYGQRQIKDLLAKGTLRSQEWDSLFTALGSGLGVIAEEMGFSGTARKGFSDINDQIANAQKQLKSAKQKQKKLALEGGTDKQIEKNQKAVKVWQEEYDRLLKKQDKSLGSFRNALKTNQISALDFLDALEKVGTGEGELAKRADDYKDTITAAARNIRNALQRLGEAGLTSLDDVLREKTGKGLVATIREVSDGIKDNLIPSLKDWVGDNGDKIVAFFDKLRNYDWVGLVSKVGKGLAQYYNIIVSFFTKIPSGFIAFMSVWAGPIGRLMQGAGGVISGFGNVVASLIKYFGVRTVGKVTEAVEGVKQVGKLGDALKGSLKTFVNATVYIGIIAEIGLVVAELAKVASYVGSLDFGDFNSNIKPLTNFAGQLAVFAGVITGVMRKFGTKDFKMLAAEGLAAGFVGIMGELGLVIHEFAKIVGEISSLDVKNFYNNVPMVKEVFQSVATMVGVLVGGGAFVASRGGGIGGVIAAAGELLAAGAVEIMRGVANVMHQFVDIVGDIANVDVPDTRKMDQVSRAIGNLRQYIFEPLAKVSVGETSGASKKMKNMADAMSYFKSMAQSLKSVKNIGSIGNLSDRIRNIMSSVDVVVGRYDKSDEKQAKIAARTLKQNKSAAKSIKGIAESVVGIQKGLQEFEAGAVTSYRPHPRLADAFNGLKQDMKVVLEGLARIVHQFANWTYEFEVGEKNIDLVKKSTKSIAAIINTLLESRESLDSLVSDEEMQAGKSNVASKLGALIIGVAEPFKDLGKIVGDYGDPNQEEVIDFETAAANMKSVASAMDDLKKTITTVVNVQNDLNNLFTPGTMQVPSARGTRTIETPDTPFSKIKKNLEKLIEGIDDINKLLDSDDMQKRLNKANIGSTNAQRLTSNISSIVASFRRIQDNLTTMGQDGRFGAGTKTPFAPSGIQKGLIKDEVITIIKRMMDIAKAVDEYNVDIDQSLISKLETIKDATTPLREIVAAMSEFLEPLGELGFDKENNFQAGDQIASIMSSLSKAFTPLVGGDINFSDVGEIAGQYASAVGQLPAMVEQLNQTEALLGDSGFTKMGHDYSWNLGRKLKAVVDGLTGAFSGLNPLTGEQGNGTNLGTAAEKLGQINGVLQQMGQANGTIFQLEAAYTQLKTAIDNIATACNNVRQAIARMKAAFENFAKYLIGYRQKIQPGIEALSVVSSYADQVRSSFDTAAWSVQNLANAINNLPSHKTISISTALGTVSNAIGSIVNRARGGVIYRAGGGSLFRPRGTDTVPAMLTPGEFIMRRAAHNKFGTAFMNRINNLDVDGAIRALSIRAGAGVFSKGGVVTNNYNRDNHANVTFNIGRASQGYSQRRANRWARALS